MGKTWHTRKRQKGGDHGFTLMELLVVLGLFSTVVVVASDIFILSNRAQRKILSLERTQADARFTMEAITREVRTGDVDFGYYAARGTQIGRPEAELALIDNTNTPIRFHQSDAGNSMFCPDTESTPCLLVTLDVNDPVSITPKGVLVRNARFYISPSSDPDVFDPGTGTYPVNIQPRVTVVLVLDSVAQKAEDRVRVQFQTTIASRTYAR